MLSLLIIVDLLLSHSNKSDSTYDDEQGGVYIDLRGLSGEMGISVWIKHLKPIVQIIDSEVIRGDKIVDS